MVSPLTIKDTEWIRQSFLVKANELEDNVRAFRVFTTASLKYTDTTPGGNFCINPPPQFTRTADLRVPNRLAKSPGMGRYYSEAIDDNSQIIYMRMGNPAFNSLTTFFTGFYNTGAARLARTGRATGIFYNLGRAAGFVVSVMNWQLLAVHLLGVAARFFLDKPSSKFYYLKPNMPSYWNAVQTIVNQIAVNRGIVPRLGAGSETGDRNLNGNYEWDDAARRTFHENAPDLFNADGSIDIYSMATRAMRLHHKHNLALEQALSEGQMDLQQGLTKVLSEVYSDDKPDYLEYLAKYAGDKDGMGATSQAMIAASAGDTNSGTGGEGGGGSGASAPDSNVEPAITSATADDGFLSFMDAELADGGAFVGFRVNHTGTVNESFSSSVAPSQLADKINGMSSSSRSTNFDLAGGNISEGVIGKTVQGILGAAKDVVAGVADYAGFSGLAALAGAAFVDIPQHWESSSASLPRGSYTIHLVSPYGNPMSQLINIHIPLAMLLATALPLSTGKQSFTSPFLVELYDKGRCQTRLGIVDSMSITRGTGNLGFTNEGHVMAIDVSLTVMDLSSVMHMPISQGINMAAKIVAGATGFVAAGPLGAAAATAVETFAEPTFDDETFFSDYMALLAGMSLPDQIYPWRKYKLNLTKQMTNWNTWFSASHFASWAGNTPPGRLASLFYKGVGYR